MRGLAVKEGLDPDKDLKPFGSGGFSIFGLSADFELLSNYTRDHPNTTHLIVQFTSAYIEPGSMPPEPGYLMWYNNSRTATDTNDAKSFLRALDQQIARELTGNANVTMKVQEAHFPLPESRFSQFDVVSVVGGVYFYLVPMIVFFVLLSGIVQEKEANLRTGMRMMGLSSPIYWATWTLQGVFFSLVTTLVLMASAAACQFAVFLRCNQFVIFLAFFMYSIALVGMACCLSAFLSKLRSAQVLGYGIILLGFVFQSILTSSYGMFLEILFSDQVPGWVVLLRWIFIQYPPTNFAKIFSDVAALSGNHVDGGSGYIVAGKGFFWADLFKQPKPIYLGQSIFYGPAPYQSLLLLGYNVVVWGLLAWYFNNVLGEGARPYYFPFTRSYWGLDQCAARSRMKRAAEAAGVHDDGLGLETAGESLRQDEESAVLVRVSSLSKSYVTADCCDSRPNMAVEDVSFEIRRGEIFGLLGHNGAGKSTTINCLTGLLQPSSGKLTIGGLEVGANLAQVRRLLGVCPQHDILFDTLTATEHLLLFARLKGMTLEEAQDEALQKLTLVGLEGVAHDRVSTFSGGMKRRLSVSISAIGDPALMLLDEPSTGMDPVNQKQMWKLIQELKKDRAILLTTHSMREAEVLADRVCVIAFGRICASGTTVELKHNFGLSYNVHVQVMDASVDTVTALMRALVPEAPLVEKQDGALTFRVAPSSMGAIAPLLGRLQELRQSNVVEEYGITETSLEDVFLGVTREAGFRYESIGRHDVEVDEFLHGSLGAENQETKKSATSSPLLPVDGGRKEDVAKEMKKTRPRPFAALMNKNIRLQSRQWGTNCCQIITPLLVLMILLVLKIVVISQLGDDIEKTILVPGIPFPLNASPDMWKEIYFLLKKFGNGNGPPALETTTYDVRSSFMKGHRPEQFLARTLLGMIPRDESEREVEATKEPSPFLSRKDMEARADPVGTQCMLFFLYSATQESAGTVGYLGPDWRDKHSGKGGMLGRLPTHDCQSYNGTVFQVPFFLPRADNRAMQDEVFADFNTLNNVSFGIVNNNPHYINLTPDAIVSFSEADADSGRLSYTYAVNDNYLKQYHRRNNFTRLDINTSAISKVEKLTNFNLQLITLQGQLQMQSLVQTAFWHQMLNTSVLNTQPGQWQIVMTMPEHVTADVIQLLNLVGALLYPVAFNLSLPMFLYLLVMEKETRIKSLMEFHGMSNMSYLASNWIFFLFMYVALASLFWGFGAALNLEVFVATAVTTMGMFWLLWGLSLISLSYFLSAFVNGKSAASMLGYTVALGGPLFATLLALGVYVIADVPMPVAWFLWPQIAMVRGIYLFTAACTLDNACYNHLWSLNASDEMASVLGMLAFDTVAFFVLFLYLDQVLPRSYGIAKHPCFCFQPLLRRWRRRRGQYDRVEHDGDEPAAALDSEVQHEQELVDTLSPYEIEHDYPLVLKHLSKRYEGASKAAVRDFSLAMTPSQVLGLLGENGAGKTTTIAMLTGLYAPSSGDAFVNGSSIVSDIDTVHASIGVCPQFSILWEELTVREHLLFFARLKGVGFLDEKHHVDESLRDYGLLSVATRKAGALSGGMKRRLCVAIALVGGSRVVFLDEPTTGLDPVSKRQLWSIVSASKTDRSVVLTTHDLFEAEILSQRIGIMGLGELRALGTPLHLKNKFASGFRLVVDCQKGADVAAVDQRLRELLRGCTLHVLNAFVSSREYRLALDDGAVTVATVFESMSQHAASLGVAAWTLGNLGIESVFENIFRETHTPQMIPVQAIN